MIRYYRVYIEDNTKKEEITKAQAVRILKRYYKDVEEVLSSSTKLYPVRTPWARYWQEEV